MVNPARKLKPSAVKNICTFPSRKTIPGKTVSIRLESILEKDYCYHLEIDSEVESYIPQPETFTFPNPHSDSGKSFTYTPDFLIKYRNKQAAFIEVKPVEIRLKDRYRSKLDEFRQLMNEQGIEFQIVDRDFICRMPYLRNLQWLNRFLNQSIPTLHTLNCLQQAFPTGAPLKTLFKATPTVNHIDIWHALAKGELTFDIKQCSIHSNPEISYA